MLEVIYPLKTHCLYFWSGTNIQKHLFSKTELRKKKKKIHLDNNKDFKIQQSLPTYA